MEEYLNSGGRECVEEVIYVLVNSFQCISKCMGVWQLQWIHLLTFINILFMYVCLNKAIMYHLYKQINRNSLLVVEL